MAGVPPIIPKPVCADLSGKVAVIAGGAGDVGEGIVRAFAEAGATVVVPSRSQAKLDELRIAAGANGWLIDAPVARFDDAELGRVREETLRRFGRVDAVVSSLGGWWGGKPLVETDAQTWERLLDGGLRSHLVMVRAFAPTLAEAGGSYTFINGAAALNPVPGSAAVSIIAAAQTMLARALMAEMQGTRVRVNQLVLTTPVATRARKTVKPDWLTDEEVGAVAAWIASDAGAMIAGSIMPLGPHPARGGETHG